MPIQPTMSLIKTPSFFSPIYSPNWFGFTASTTNTLATDLFLVADLKVLNQSITTSTVLTNVGRFKSPIRVDGVMTLDTGGIMKSYVTYPYNTGSKIYYGSGVASYVDEQVGFGNPISSFPTISPEQDGVVRYRMDWGLEYKPNATYSILAPQSASPTYSSFTFLGQDNVFCDVGDIVTVRANSGLFSYYNATMSVTSCYTFSVGARTDTIMFTDYIFSDTLGAITLTASGEVTTVYHKFGTTSDFIGYNGTRQWDEQDVNFDNVYYFRVGATGSPLYSTSTYSNFQFMNDRGRTSDEAIAIRPGQGERIRFLANLQTNGASYSTNRIAYYGVETYDRYLNLIGTYSTGITDNPGGTLYPYKCFTLQAFDRNGVLSANAATAGTPIVDGYYYKFFVNGFEPGGVTQSTYASIWYRAEDPCDTGDNYRIKFLNRQGTWCYFNFNGDSRKTTTISRTEWRRPNSYDDTLRTPVAGGSTTVTSGYKLSKLGNQNLLSIKATDTFELFSGWVTEDVYEWLQQLVASSKVFIFKDEMTLKTGEVLRAVNIPIIITNSTYQFKTQLRDQVFNIRLEYKLAYDQEIQNI